MTKSSVLHRIVRMTLVPFRIVLFILKPLIALVMPLACMVITANLLILPWVGICHCFFPDYPTWTKVVLIILGAAGFFLGMELSFKISDSGFFKK